MSANQGLYAIWKKTKVSIGSKFGVFKTKFGLKQTIFG